MCVHCHGEEGKEMVQLWRKQAMLLLEHMMEH